MSGVLDSGSVARVRQALEAAGVATQVIELPGAARTAKAAAEFLGCELGQIANSLVFQGTATGSAYLVMSSGARRVDIERLAASAGERVRKAEPDFVRERTGFAIGGVPPVGHVSALRTFVERSLAAHSVLWAAGGHPHTVFKLSYADLVRITGAAEIDAAASP